MSAGSEDRGSGLQPSPLLAAGTLLADRGVYGLIWFGDDFIVTARYGRLAGFVEVGEPLREACLPLIGLEESIHALKDTTGEVLELPAVRMVNAGEELPRLNLTIFWFAGGAQYIMLVARATQRSDFDAELSRQMRARLMAETEAAAKSRELARANVELARANRDLEDFAAIISHDLKSPLRALRFASEDLAAQLDAGDLQAARRRLDEIGERSRRMSDMMTSLLDYASVGRKSEVAEPVATEELARAVVASLEKPAGFEIMLAGEWPVIETARAALDLVLRNLVQNAIVHHDRGDGRIVLDAREQHRALVITVTDDGPGIAPEHHEVILLPFRSLSGKPGSTGMGLAFVNRTIETIGGRLSVLSDPARARGTTFELVWPRQLNPAG